MNERKVTNGALWRREQTHVVPTSDKHKTRLRGGPENAGGARPQACLPICYRQGLLERGVYLTGGITRGKAAAACWAPRAPAGGSAPSPCLLEGSAPPSPVLPVALETRSLWRRRREVGWVRGKDPGQPGCSPPFVRPRPCWYWGGRRTVPPPRPTVGGGGACTLGVRVGAQCCPCGDHSLRAASPPGLPVPWEADTPTSPTPLASSDVSKCINYQEKKM